VPLVVKVAPDLEHAQIQAIADTVRRHGIDGLIATNTSVSREGVRDCATQPKPAASPARRSATARRPCCAHLPTS